MKKLALILFIAAVVATTCLFGADAYMWTPRGGSDSAYIQKGDEPWSALYIDTFTLHVEDGDSIVVLGSTFYNFQFRTLNGAEDSGSVLVTLDAQKSFFLNDSFARLYLPHAVGLNTADDYFIAPFEANEIHYRPVVGGTADSTVLIEQIFLR